jgi:hypothetical protein
MNSGDTENQMLVGKKLTPDSGLEDEDRVKVMTPSKRIVAFRGSGGGMPELVPSQFHLNTESPMKSGLSSRNSPRRNNSKPGTFGSIKDRKDVSRGTMPVNSTQLMELATQGRLMPGGDSREKRGSRKVSRQGSNTENEPVSDLSPMGPKSGVKLRNIGIKFSAMGILAREDQERHSFAGTGRSSVSRQVSRDPVESVRDGVPGYSVSEISGSQEDDIKDYRKRSILAITTNFISTGLEVETPVHNIRGNNNYGRRGDSFGGSVIGDGGKFNVGQYFDDPSLKVEEKDLNPFSHQNRGKELTTY